MSIVTIALIIAVVIYVIGSQIIGGPLRGRRLMVLPIVLTLIGMSELANHHGQHVTPAPIALIAASSLVAAIVGVLQGASMRLEERGGALWGQMPVRRLWLWGLLILSRVAFYAVAHGSHEQIATSGGAVILGLGFNRLAQGLVVASRALAAGIPFANEKDGSSFLAGTFGSARGGGSTQRSTAFAGSPALSRHDVGPRVRQLSDRFADR